MPDLIPVHGGLPQPVNCTVPPGEEAAFKGEAAKLTKVPVPDADLSTVYRIADGALSPLVGFMTSSAYNRVLEESVIESQGKLYAWTIPLSLPVTGDVAAQLTVGQRVALANSKGDVVGTLDVEDIFAYDKPRYLKSVYLTERTDHPGGDMVLKGDADKTHLLGGRVRALPQPKHPKFGNTSARQPRCAVYCARKAGIAWSRFRRETRCTGRTNTRLSTVSNSFCGRVTTPAPA
jgi:sulfate adenylyltransferase